MKQASLIIFSLLCCFSKGNQNSVYEIRIESDDSGVYRICSKVFLKFFGTSGESSKIEIKCARNGSSTNAYVKIQKDIGEIQSILITNNNNDSSCSWFLREVKIKKTGESKQTIFPIHKWLRNGNQSSIFATKEIEDCGISNHARIVNGIEALPNSWPWMVQIKKADSWKRHRCAGTLIHPSWVLIAAHCVYMQPMPKIYKVTLGEHTLEKNENTEQIIYGSKIVIHPKFDIRKYEYDIALIKLARPARINSFVKMACLPKQNQLTTNGKVCFVTGWGKTKLNGTKSATLQQVDLRKVPNNLCKQVMSRLTNLNITLNMICGGGDGKYTCRGDSGGALNCLNGQKRFEVHGVTSSTIPTCGFVGGYNVFARVSKFADWIKSNIYSVYVKYL